MTLVVLYIIIQSILVGILHHLAISNLVLKENWLCVFILSTILWILWPIGYLISCIYAMYIKYKNPV